MRGAAGAAGPEHPAKPHTGATSGEIAPAASGLTVLLADDQVPVRAGIKRAIEPHGMRVVAEASNVEDAVQEALVHRPDICVIAVELPGNGIEATRRIKESLPATKIVMMTGSARDEDLFKALRVGADGYLLMSTPASRLPHAITGVMRGEAALPREMTGRLVLEFRERGARRRVSLASTDTEVELSAREFEVLQRLRKHDGTAEIAVHLGISQVTVRRHVSSLLRKLGVSSRQRAVEIIERAEQGEQPGVEAD